MTTEEERIRRLPIQIMNTIILQTQRGGEINEFKIKTSTYTSISKIEL